MHTVELVYPLGTPENAERLGYAAMSSLLKSVSRYERGRDYEFVEVLGQQLRAALEASKLLEPAMAQHYWNGAVRAAWMHTHGIDLGKYSAKTRTASEK